jgi:hypothetical protein
MGSFVTIDGVTVDAVYVIDALVAKVGELALENASLRAQVTTWSVLARSRVSDGVPDAPDPSQGSTGGSGEPVEGQFDHFINGVAP